MVLGIKIKKIRELRNLTQDYVAKQLDISQSTYSRIEKDDGDLTVSQLNKIAEILEVKVEELINFNDKVVFNNYANSTQGYIIHQYVSDKERELYEKTIKLLEDKIKFLEK